jgi:hypothetical protein
MANPNINPVRHYPNMGVYMGDVYSAYFGKFSVNTFVHDDNGNLTNVSVNRQYWHTLTEMAEWNFGESNKP